MFLNMPGNLDKIQSGETPKSQEIIKSLWEKFPEIAKGLIKQKQDLSDKRNQSFLENPDSPLEHEPRWHQWGIITHTKMFESFYRQEIPKYLESWGLSDRVAEQMSSEIDGMKKDQLLNISIPLHDLGKFTDRRFVKKPDGSLGPTFAGHEATSGKIVRTPEFSGMLKGEYGLTDKQIEYVARCAELHYVLASIRDGAKMSPGGFTLEFAQSDKIRGQAESLMAEYDDFKLEIGLLYLADSLAKTDIRIDAKNDQEIKAATPSIEETLKSRNLNPNLINAVKQLPVNIAAVKTYLTMWAERQ